ncbi:MAG: phage tail tube protein [Pikeienuella sp.]
MANAITEKFEELVLQIEDPDNAGTYLNLCGLIDVEIARSASVDTAEVPDCDDESLPLSVEKQVRSVEVSISASGVWAQTSWGLMSDWFYSSSTQNIRLQNAKAASGDTEFEAGPALLVNLSNSRTKGQKVTATLEIQFDGTPARTAKA